MNDDVVEIVKYGHSHMNEVVHIFIINTIRDVRNLCRAKDNICLKYYYSVDLIFCGNAKINFECKFL